MNSERTIEDARSVCRDLREIFVERNFPEGTLEEVQRLCGIARLVIDDRYCEYELQLVERYASHLLQGNTAQWGTGPIPGDVYLRELIIELLTFLDRLLRTRALSARSAKARSRAAMARRHARDAGRMSSDASRGCAHIATIPGGLLPPRG